jgi:tetratricopeptide (TPR) repeat protein
VNGLLGRVVAGRFHLEEKAGQGAAGQVFRARDAETGGLVALKLLRSDTGEQHLRRFLREATVLRRLSHDALVRYVASGVDDEGQPWLAMEWVAGPSLQAVLAARAPRDEEVLALGARLAAALGVLHEHGVVHRDVKPLNVLCPGGKLELAKLCDLGVARSLPDTALTSEGLVLGTPGYLSPEQARGDSVGSAADVYSLGTVLFRCLAGRLPFDAADALGMLVRVVIEDPPPMLTVRPDTPLALAELVDRCLFRDARERPGDGAEVAALLAAVRPHAEQIVPTHRIGSTLSGEERHVAVVLVAQAAQGPLGDDVLGAMASLDVVAHRLADGSIVATTREGGPPVDQAVALARAASALVRRAPRAFAAIASGTTARDRFTRQAGVSGEVVDRAVSLLERRRPGAVLLDEPTSALLEGKLELARDEGSGMPMLEPEALDTARPRSRTLSPGRRTRHGTSARFVGRERALSLLATTYARALVDGVAGAVVVTSPPGLGKTRLAAELLRELERLSPRPRALSVSCDRLRSGSPFFVASELFASATGASPLASAEERAALVREALGPLEPELERELTTLASELRSSTSPSAPRAHPLVVRDEIRRTFVRWLEHELARAPLVLIIDDAQWADAPSLELVEHALAALPSARLFVLGLGRDDVRATFPRLFHTPLVRHLTLGPIDRTASRTLLAELLGDEAAPELLDRLAPLGEGNPFVLEELARAALARGPGAPLPESVLGLVQARLDELDPAARLALRAASALGGTFPLAPVKKIVGSAMTEPELTRALETLCDKGLLLALGGGAEGEASRVGGAPAPNEQRGSRGFAFRSLLVAEAAYASLTPTDLRRAHRHALEWLLSTGQADALVLARHAEAAGDGARAAEQLTRAARAALVGDDLGKAAELAERGLELDPRGPHVAELASTAAEALRWRGDYAGARALARRAIDASRPGSALFYRAVEQLLHAAHRQDDQDAILHASQWLRDSQPEPDAREAQVTALAMAATRLSFAGQRRLAQGMLELAEDAARGSSSPAITGQLAYARGIAAHCAGDLGGDVDHGIECVSAFMGAGDPRRLGVARVNLAVCYRDLGLWASAASLLEETIRDALRFGLAPVALHGRSNLGYVRALEGRSAEAMALLDQAIAEARATGDRGTEASTLTYRARTLSLMGAHELGARLADQALVLTDTPAGRAFALACKADALLGAGDPGGAYESASAGMALLDALGAIEEGEALLRLVHAEALAERGFRAEASAALSHAARRLRERAATVGEPSWRASFLSAVPENEKTLALERRLCE